MLEYPHEVFDSSPERAEQEHKKVAERLAEIGDAAHYREGVEFQTRAEHGGGAPTIEIPFL